MRVAIHQPNFVPHFPFFYKMAMSDVLVLLDNVQFEKNGYQNRFQYKDKWITMPVEHGLKKIHDKKYINGENVSDLNKQWIVTIARTLGIKTKIKSPYSDTEVGLRLLGHDIDYAPKNPTERLIYIMNHLGGDIYITNPDAKNKYLDEALMHSHGIDIEYCKVPKHLQKSTFEIIEEYGLEGAMKQLPRKLCKV